MFKENISGGKVYKVLKKNKEITIQNTMKYKIFFFLRKSFFVHKSIGVLLYKHIGFCNIMNMRFKISITNAYYMFFKTIKCNNNILWIMFILHNRNLAYVNFCHASCWININILTTDETLCITSSACIIIALIYVLSIYKHLIFIDDTYLMIHTSNCIH